MSTKLAVAIIHGVGKQDPNFADGMKQELIERFSREIKDEVQNPEDQLVIESVYWAPVLQKTEDELWKRVKQGGDLDFLALRQLIIDFAADAIAYQPAKNERDVYDNIHEIFARVLQRLAQNVGANAPLAVIAHSLGSIIASNYFYDLQKPGQPHVPDKVKKIMSNTPLERGETFALFYTLGSPIALWSLRYNDFGDPVQVPSPQLKNYYPNLKGEWLNFFDEDDVIGYPLRVLNDQYKKLVTQDIPVNVGNWLSSWNPASHLGYWTDNDVTIPIAKSLAEAWKSVNQ